MHIVDITLENAQQLLIDESFNRPVQILDADSGKTGQ